MEAVNANVRISQYVQLDQRERLTKTLQFVNAAKLCLEILHLENFLLLYTCLLTVYVYYLVCLLLICLLCFDAVGWVAGRASGL